MLAWKTSYRRLSARLATAESARCTDWDVSGVLFADMDVRRLKATIHGPESDGALMAHALTAQARGRRVG